MSLRWWQDLLQGVFPLLPPPARGQAGLAMAVYVFLLLHPPARGQTGLARDVCMFLLLHPPTKGKAGQPSNPTAFTKEP